MLRSVLFCWIVSSRLAIISTVGQGHTPTTAPDHRQMVVLSWDTTGDFGPDTPGTKTAGWQEAINYCVEHGRDLYVKGGWGARKAIYHVQDTIYIPATQDFRIDGGVYVLNWIGPADRPDKDLMLIDSTMNGEYHFGILVYGGAGAAMRVKPVKPVPVDGFPVVVETEISSTGGIADPHPFNPHERQAGTGLVLDATQAPIVNSKFEFVGGLLNYRTCVDISGEFTMNHFDGYHLHTNAHKSTLMKIGPQCTQNVFRLAIGVDQGATGVKGIEVAGFNNVFEIKPRGGFTSGNELILLETARGNRIDLIHGKERAHPLDFITDQAKEATNQVTMVGAAMPFQRLKIKSGDYVYTQRLNPAAARIVGGDIQNVQISRHGDNIDYGVPAGDILLSVGDQLRIVSRIAPELIIIPFKNR